VRLQSIRRRAALVIPIRAALGIGWLVAAILAGAGGTPALIGFVIGALGCAFALLNDPRSRLLHGKREPAPYPADAVLDSPFRHLWTALLPSTLGVNILAAVAIVPQPELTAVLGGVSAGLGLAALVALPAAYAREEVFVDRHGAIYTRQ
jgi:hypothetical protein